MWRPVTPNLLVLACACLFFATGCSAFRSGQADSLVTQPPRPLPEIQATPPADAPPADPRANPATDTEADSQSASCYVEIRAVGDEPKRIRMLLDDAPYVQKVLEQTGLVKKFRNMQIELKRKLPDGTRHKLDVRYDAKRKQVVSAFDYALHADDLLVIQQDSLTSFDEMLKKLAGPLAQ